MALELKMKSGLAKSALSHSGRRLVELMQQLNYGRVEHLQIRDGQPVLDPMPRTVREYKLAGENGPRSESDISDFRLKEQVVDLFRHFAAIGTAMIEVLEIKGGLPFRMMVAEETS